METLSDADIVDSEFCIKSGRNDVRYGKFHKRALVVLCVCACVCVCVRWVFVSSALSCGFFKREKEE